MYILDPISRFLRDTCDLFSEPQAFCIRRSGALLEEPHIVPQSPGDLSDTGDLHKQVRLSPSFPRRQKALDPGAYACVEGTSRVGEIRIFFHWDSFRKHCPHKRFRHDARAE